MSVFTRDETLCNRLANQCKQRNKCLRYLRVQGEQDWSADYWSEFGQFCTGFIPLKKKELPSVKITTKAKED